MRWEDFPSWCERHCDGIFWWAFGVLALLHMAGL